MLDIRFIRENPEAVKENIKKKFQDQKLPLVDQVLELDAANRAAMTEARRESRGPAQWAAVVATTTRPASCASPANASQRSVSSGTPWQVSSTITRSRPKSSMSWSNAARAAAVSWLLAAVPFLSRARLTRPWRQPVRMYQCPPAASASSEISYRGSPLAPPRR